MSNAHDPPDPFLERLEREIRRDVPVDDARIDRVKAELHGLPAPGHGTNRLRSPALVLAAAAMLALAFLLGRFSVRIPAPDTVGHTQWTGTATRSVRFVLEADSARRVHVVGIFNDWDPDATPLTRDGSGLWTVEVPLPPGRHEYAFLVDGLRWVPDADAPRAPEDDFGTHNSVILVQATQ